MMFFHKVLNRFRWGVFFLFILFGWLTSTEGIAGESTVKPQEISNEVNLIFYAYYGQYIGDKHDTSELVELKDSYLTVLVSIENTGDQNIKIVPSEFSATSSYGNKIPLSKWTKIADKYLKFRALLPETVEPGQKIERYILLKRSPKKEDPENLSTLHWKGNDYPVEPEKELEW